MGIMPSGHRHRPYAEEQLPNPQAKRPCSYFVEGKCRRLNCKFSHELGSITCRFWIKSSCLKGDICPFMHGTTAKKNVRNRSCSDAEQFVRYGSGEEPFAKEQLVNNTSVQPVEHVLEPKHKSRIRKAIQIKTKVKQRLGKRIQELPNTNCGNQQSLPPRASSEDWTRTVQFIEEPPSPNENPYHPFILVPVKSSSVRLHWDDATIADVARRFPPAQVEIEAKEETSPFYGLGEEFDSS